MSHFKKSHNGHLMRGVSGHLMRESHCDRFAATQVDIALSWRDCTYPSTDCTGTGYGGGGSGQLLRDGLLDFYGCLNGWCLWYGTFTWQFGHFAEDCSDVFTLTGGTGNEVVWVGFDCSLQKWGYTFAETLPTPTYPSQYVDEVDSWWGSQSCDGVEAVDTCQNNGDGTSTKHFRAGTNYIRVNPLP